MNTFVSKLAYMDPIFGSKALVFHGVHFRFKSFLSLFERKNEGKIASVQRVGWEHFGTKSRGHWWPFKEVGIAAGYFLIIK